MYKYRPQFSFRYCINMFKTLPSFIGLPAKCCS